LIEVFISFAIPFLLLFEIIPTNISIPVYCTGVVLSVIGLWLMIWTRFNRNKDWGFMGDKAGNVLFTGGPYRLTRHPYYIGAIFTGIGIYLQLNYLLAFLMIPVILFIGYVIKKEDRFLEEQFGQQYKAYKEKVGVTPWFYK
jgi:protein-S-isoprenylcysteine O-methyltransferase Ste14